MTSLSRADVKQDLREADAATHSLLPPELSEEGEEDESVRVVVGVKRPVPVTSEEMQGRLQRYRR